MAGRPGVPPAFEPGPEARRKGLILGLLACLVVLLLHAGIYTFLTDDAFISFRYARNLAEGHGLVFNPGGERVEGYSNFLWVLLLAALRSIGVAPERAAVPMGFLATVVLWSAVVAYSWREHSQGRRAWVVLVPATALALNRSFAVWTTSGLETRFFEALLVLGVLRCSIELSALGSARPVKVLSPWLFGLATLTRPDGLLLAACALAAAVAWLVRARRPAWGFIGSWWPFGVLVGGHFLFRRLYYQEWLPNTYYAKVGGRMWWDSGARYFGAFVLEYALYLWIPVLALAWLHHRRRGTLHIPILILACILPHAMYVAAIGGDHFEYRPLDLYFPLLSLLLADGAREWLARGLSRPALAAWMLLAAVGLTEIPWQSHRQFVNRYLPGFPGDPKGDAERARFLLPARDPLFRWPILQSVAGAHRDLVAKHTSQFVGIRQEEHRLFLQTARDEGERLRRAIERGELPRDVRIAMDCVGAIPYLTNAWTLDRLGLTDARVAHSKFISHFMAHGKYATIDYARERGVDLWAVDGVHPTTAVTSVLMIANVEAARMDTSGPFVEMGEMYAADLMDGSILLCRLPRGLADAARRMPRLKFSSIRDSAFRQEFFVRCAAACAESLRLNPDDSAMGYRLGYALLASRQFEQAWQFYRRELERRPFNLPVLRQLYASAKGMGDRRRMSEAMEMGIAIARRTNRPSMEASWRSRWNEDSVSAAIGPQ